VHIVFLSHYYPPEVNAPASRTSEHCREWVRAGHRVTVVTCAPNHPAGKIYPGYRNRLFQRETQDGVEIVRVWTLLAANQGFLLRTLNYLSYMLGAGLALPRIDRPDVVVSTSPQFFCGLMGYLARLVRRAPWVLEIRDIWPESIVTIGAMRKGLGTRLLEAVERFAYRKADRIVAVTDSFVQHIAERSQGRDKIDVIKNGVDLTLFTNDAGGRDMRGELGLDDKVVAAYVGTHGMAHGLDIVLDAAELLRDDARIVFLLVGDGAERARLVERAKVMQLENVRILGQRPKADMPGIWSTTDISLILLRKNDLFRKVLPSKMFEAMAMECPIVLGVEGEARKLLDAASAGLGIEPGNAAELAATVKRLADDADLRARLGLRGGAYAREHFDRARLAASYLELLTAVASGGRGNVAAAEPKTIALPLKGSASFHRCQFGLCWSSLIEMVTGRFARVAREVAFAWHIPLGKLLRRAELNVRRRVRDRLSVVSAAAVTQPPPRAPAPPLALMPVRSCTLLQSPSGFAATFLDRTVELGAPIDWNAAGSSTRDQLWRMNLHYMEYLEGADDRSFAMLLRSWLAANAAERRGAWRDSWNSYALSLRVVVWMQQLAVRASRIEPALAERADTSLATQLRFLERNLETDLGGNHLVKNIKALIWGGSYFAGDEAARWRRIGLDLLAREIAAQVLADGMHDERSASYHAQVFADLLECRHALGDDPLGGRLDDCLHRMAQVVADLAHPDAGPVLFNDSGLGMAYAPRDVLAACRAACGRDFAPRRVFTLPDAGYFGFRGETSYLVADCGRIAPDDLPAHGHGDVLSFEWSVAGQRLIVDQGVYEYVAGEKRACARSASSHNTLCFEGADQADFFGAFRCGRRPSPRVIAYEARGNGFRLVGTHDGFDSLPGRPRHVRTFEVSDKLVRIEDRIEGAPTRAARIGFLFHPEARIEEAGREVRIARGPARVLLRTTVPVAVETAAWWPDMGRELPTMRLVMTVPPGMTAVTSEFAVIDHGFETRSCA
jgi:glycosyltransferase involved in cell wall biosynthesis/uncharacterized heparinase superfamily protein